MKIYYLQAEGKPFQPTVETESPPIPFLPQNVNPTFAGALGKFDNIIFDDILLPLLPKRCDRFKRRRDCAADQFIRVGFVSKN
jgi:hypothetical protein